MPTIKQLNQRHPNYHEKYITRLRALYEGEERFEAQLGDFLPQRPHEPAQMYALRKREAVYRNYIGPITDYFTSLLFSEKPVVNAKRPGSDKAELELPDYYSAFREDCNGAGQNIDELLNEALTDAMVVKQAWVRLKHPDATEANTVQMTQAEFERRKLGDTLIQFLPTENVLDWGTDSMGNLLWVIAHAVTAERGGIDQGRDKETHTWEYLDATKVDTYEITYEISNKPTDDTNVPLVSTVAHRYGTVPLVCLDLKPKLHVAGRLRSPQLAHFQLSNAQKWGITATCYAMPVVTVADPAAFEKQRMGAGYGYTLNVGESVEWTAPPAASFDVLASEIASHRDELFRIAHAMALGVDNNKAATVGRSAESKHADAQATKTALLGYSRAVKELAGRIYALISKARGEEYIWSIDGLDDFAAADIGGLVDVLVAVEGAGGIPSKTWQAAAKIPVAQAILPDMDQATKQIVEAEINAGVEEQTVEAKQARETEKLTAIGGALNDARNKKILPGNGVAQGNLPQ